MSKYNYDENAETWPYFAFTLVGVVVVPFTISTVSSTFSKKAAGVHGTIKTDFKPSNFATIAKFRRSLAPSKVFNWKNVFLVVGWAILIALGWYVSGKEIAAAAMLFDPFEILGVSSSATEREIKSAYRKLSIKMHPDKLGNISGDEKAKAETAFVLVSKAYKALTDPETKENFQKYGHPDGPQAVSQGIALPKFLIESQGVVVVLVYVFVIALLLPYIVRSWWSSVKSYTKKGIRTETSTMFVEKLLNSKPTVLHTPEVVLEWVCHSQEFEEGLPNKTPEQILKLIKAYCNREGSVDHDTLFVVSKLPVLLEGLLDIAAYFRIYEVADACIDALKIVAQAVPVSGSTKYQLLQLPGVDPKAVVKSDVKTLGKLFTLNSDQQKKALGIESDAALKQALDVAKGVPILKLLKAEFVVPGEDIIPPTSLAHIVLKVLVKSPSQHGVVDAASVPKEKLEEEESFELLQDPFKVLKSQPELPTACTPYFPAALKTSWIATLAIQKDGKLIEQPESITHLDLSNLELSNEEFKKELKGKGENLTVGTIKVRLTQPSPPDEGNYEFRLVIKSNVYFGGDLDIPMVMKVTKPTEVVDQKIYEVPPPEEESIAGAMAQFRGEPVVSHGGDEYFDSEDEDELVEAKDLSDDDWSDIDTDTDEEEDEKEDPKTK